MFIDDEANILNALRRSLRDLPWEMVFHTEPQDALKDLESREFAVLVSDYKMPDINGVEFLEYCRFRQRNAVRIILSAFAEKDAVLEAVNKAEIYRFITKPWDDDQLRMMIRSAMELSELMNEKERLLEVIQEQEDVIAEQQQLLNGFKQRASN